MEKALAERIREFVEFCRSYGFTYGDGMDNKIANLFLTLESLKFGSTLSIPSVGFASESAVVKMEDLLSFGNANFQKENYSRQDHHTGYTGIDTITFLYTMHPYSFTDGMGRRLEEARETREECEFLGIPYCDIHNGRPSIFKGLKREVEEHSNFAFLSHTPHAPNCTESRKLANSYATFLKDNFPDVYAQRVEAFWRNMYELQRNTR